MKISIHKQDFQYKINISNTFLSIFCFGAYSILSNNAPIFLGWKLMPLLCDFFDRNGTCRKIFARKISLWLREFDKNKKLERDFPKSAGKKDVQGCCFKLPYNFRLHAVKKIWKKMINLLIFPIMSNNKILLDVEHYTLKAYVYKSMSIYL